MSNLKRDQLARAVAHPIVGETVVVEARGGERVAVVSDQDQQWYGTRAEWQAALAVALELTGARR